MIDNCGKTTVSKHTCLDQSKELWAIKKVLFVATVVKTHIMPFHLPYIQWFKKNGFETHVCARNDYEHKRDCHIPYCDIFFDLPFERSPFSLNNLKVYRWLKKVIEIQDYDIIHCHTPVGGFLTRVAARKLRRSGSKIIYTAHGFHFYKGAPLKNWLLFYPAERFLAGFTDVLITINREDYNVAQGFKAKKVVYVPGVGIDIKKFSNVKIDKKRKRKEIGLPDSAYVMLSVGELIKRKNHEVALKALAKIDNRDIIYVVCGQGELDESLKELAKKLEVNTMFLGFRNDVPEICAAADLFVFPSFQEGLPVALMEAMASGLPVVCSNIRGNRDLIQNGEGGYLVEPGDVEGFAESIEKLLHDPELRALMGENNCKETKKYEIGTVKRLMEIIYDQANNS